MKPRRVLGATAFAAAAALVLSGVTLAVINNGATNGKDDEVNGWHGLDNPDGQTGTYSIDNNWQDFSISEWAEPNHDWVRERFMLFHQNRIDKFWQDRNDKALDFEQRIKHQDYYNFLNAWNTNVPFTKAPEGEGFIEEGIQGYSEVDTEVKDITSFVGEFNYFLDLKWDAQMPPVANAPTFDSEVEYCNKFFVGCNFDGTGRFWKMVPQQ